MPTHYMYVCDSCDYRQRRYRNVSKCPECGGHLSREEYSDLFLWQLKEIQKYDEVRDYTERNALVFHALSEATGLGLKCGLWKDPDEPDWPVVWIELPTGQVSWHIKLDESKWDGHTTEEKYRRIKEFCKG